MTLWKELVELCRTGELRRLGGRRGFVPADSRGACEGHQKQDTGQRHHIVARALVEDLAAGNLDPQQSLPPYKVLIQRYGSCYTVVRAALESLVEKGTLVRYKRGYRRFPLRPRTSGSCVTVISGTTDMRELCSVGTRTTELWRSLENQTMAVGLPVVFLRLLPGGRFRGADGREFSSLHEAERSVCSLGHIVLPLGMSGKQLIGLRELLPAAKGPVAVLEESARPLRLEKTTRRAQMVSFAIGFGRLPGYIVGRRLLELGHRNVAFLCLTEKDVAFGERLTGMQEAFGELGLGSHVHGTTSPRWNGGVQALTRGAFHSGALSALNAAAAKAEQKWMREKRSPAPRRELAEALRQSHREAVRRLYYEDEAQGLFSAALEAKDITAWVAINDELALMAMRFLQRRRVPVPRRISVVGFDDSVDAFGAGLASYNFNANGVVRAMLEHIVARRAMPGLKRSDRGMEVPGTLVLRRSLTTGGF